MSRRAGVIVKSTATLLYLITLYLLLFHFSIEGVELFVTLLISYVFIGLSLVGLLVSKQTVPLWFSWIGALVSLVVFGYSIEGYLTIKLCLGVAFLMTASMTLRWPRNLISDGIAIAVLTMFQRTSSLFGETLLVKTPPHIDVSAEVALIAVFSATAVVVSLVQLLSERLSEAEQTVSHLDVTIDRLSQFNQDLQRYARMADEEAITKERNRISREIHDISGYIFTNLIALMDAAISMGGKNPEALMELHLAARAQAKEGLQETRRALRELRASDSHRDRGIAAIFKIKTVFERVTGITVNIETGNMPPHFNDEIDMAIYRVVQEALTNAMRHGRAKTINVQFWIVQNTLELCVQDDGVGAKEIAKGIGLSGMEERVGHLGGIIRAANAPEGGFRLVVKIPLHPSLVPTVSQGTGVPVEGKDGN
jgi:signal transduction histidine kinase